MKKLVIIGVGGFAKDVEWLIERINNDNKEWDLLGFVDNETEKQGVIGNDAFIQQYPCEINVAIAIGNPAIRKEIVRKYKANSNVLFPNLIDPSVIRSTRFLMGEGNIICAGTLIAPDVSMESYNIVNLDCTIGHDAVLKSFVTLNPSVNVSGNVCIESESNIGTGAQILQGKRIGKNVVVGAGAVVNKDLPDACTAVGVPASIIKKFTVE